MKLIPIYLTGPVRNFSSHQKEEFEKAKQKLESVHQCKVVSVLELYEEFDPGSSDCPHDDIMKQRLTMLLLAEMVVMLNDFEYDERASFEFKTAKFLNIKTLGINFALKPESTDGNRIDNSTEPESTHASDQQE